LQVYKNRNLKIKYFKEDWLCIYLQKHYIPLQLHADFPWNIGNELTLHQSLLGLKCWEETLIQEGLSTIAPGGHAASFAASNHKHYRIRCSFP
jgi:hypothetical protein